MADYTFSGPGSYGRSSSRGSSSGSRGSSSSSYSSNEPPEIDLSKSSLDALKLLNKSIRKEFTATATKKIRKQKEEEAKVQKEQTDAVESLAKKINELTLATKESTDEAVKRTVGDRDLQRAVASMAKYLQQKDEDSKKITDIIVKRYDKDNTKQLRQDTIKKAYEEQVKKQRESIALKQLAREVEKFSRKTKLSHEKSMEALGIHEKFKEPLQEHLDERKESGKGQGFIKGLTSKISEIKDAISEGFSDFYREHGDAIKGALLGPLTLITKPFQEFLGPLFSGVKNMFSKHKKEIFKKNPSRNDVVKTADMGSLYIADTMKNIFGHKDKTTGERTPGFLGRIFKKKENNLTGVSKKDKLLNSPKEENKKPGILGNLFKKKENNLTDVSKKEKLLNAPKEENKKPGILDNLFKRKDTKLLGNSKNEKDKEKRKYLYKNDPTEHDIAKTGDMGALGIIAAIKGEEKLKGKEEPVEKKGLLGNLEEGGIKGLMTLIPKLLKNAGVIGAIAAVAVGAGTAIALKLNDQNQKRQSLVKSIMSNPEAVKWYKKRGADIKHESLETLQLGEKIRTGTLGAYDQHWGHHLGESKLEGNLIDTADAIQSKEQSGLADQMTQMLQKSPTRYLGFDAKTGNLQVSGDGKTWITPPNNAISQLLGPGGRYYANINNAYRTGVAKNSTSLNQKDVNDVDQPTGGISTLADVLHLSFNSPEQVEIDNLSQLYKKTGQPIKFANGGLVIPKNSYSGVPAMIAEHGRPEGVFNGNQLNKILDGSLGSVEITRLLGEMSNVDSQLLDNSNKDIQLTEQKEKDSAKGGGDFMETNTRLDKMITLLQKLVDKKITVNTPPQTHRDLEAVLVGAGLY